MLNASTTDKEKNPKYWLVGAFRGGKDDHTNTFVRKGYWELFWDDSKKPELAKARDRISAGDRIAIKAIRSNIPSMIAIKAMGVVKEVADKRVYVDWL